MIKVRITKEVAFMDVTDKETSEHIIDTLITKWQKGKFDESVFYTINKKTFNIYLIKAYNPCIKQTILGNALQSKKSIKEHGSQYSA